MEYKDQKIFENKHLSTIENNLRKSEDYSSIIKEVKTCDNAL